VQQVNAINLKYPACLERINVAIKPFEHAIVSPDLVYRGLQCWHQYNSNNTLVDLVWKVEICQLLGQHGIGVRDYANSDNCAPCDCHCGIDTVSQSFTACNPIELSAQMGMSQSESYINTKPRTADVIASVDMNA
jgi:hypothetical protein